MSGKAYERSLRLMSWAIHAIGVSMLVTGACVYHFVFAALISHQHDRHEQEAFRLERLLATKSQVERRFRDVDATLSKLQKRAQQTRAGIPDEPQESEFLRQVTRAADQEALKIRDYQMGAVKEFASYSQLDVRLQGEGEFRSICGFLERLSQLPRVKTVQRMKVSRSGGGKVYPVDLTLTLYFGAHSEAG